MEGEWELVVKFVSGKSLTGRAWKIFCVPEEGRAEKPYSVVSCGLSNKEPEIALLYKKESKHCYRHRALFLLLPVLTGGNTIRTVLPYRAIARYYCCHYYTKLW